MNNKSWTVVFSVCLLALSLSGCANNIINEKAMELSGKKTPETDEIPVQGTIVIATKDVPEGEIICSECVEVREIDQSKIPQDAIRSETLVVGRKSKYGIGQGQIITVKDVAPK